MGQNSQGGERNYSFHELEDCILERKEEWSDQSVDSFFLRPSEGRKSADKLKQIQANRHIFFLMLKCAAELARREQPQPHLLEALFFSQMFSCNGENSNLGVTFQKTIREKA